MYTLCEYLPVCRCCLLIWNPAGNRALPLQDMKETKMHRKIFGLSAILAVMALTACETMQGAGRDLSTAGQMIEQESAQTQAGM